MSEAPVPLRASRERDLITATRRLFDERGFRDAPVEEIAKSVGIAKGLIYRQFSSKEELFVLTVTDYLAELAAEIERAAEPIEEPRARLERIAETFAGFCRRYPAFLDCSLALMHGPAERVRDSVSESVWFRLGTGMMSCIDQLAEALRRGVEAGAFELADPDFTANLLWTQTLGAMHLARIGVGVRRAGPGVPGLFSVSPEEVVSACVASALASVGAKR